MKGLFDNFPKLKITPAGVYSDGGENVKISTVTVTHVDGTRHVIFVFIQIEPHFESSVCRIFDRIHTDPRNTGGPELRIERVPNITWAAELFAVVDLKHIAACIPR